MRTNSVKEESQTARYSGDVDQLLDGKATTEIVSESDGEPTEEQIARRANQIWRLNGCPEGTADADWFEAAAQLKEFRR